MSKQTTSTTITALKHADKRVNIPTEELRDFVVDDEQAPKSLRYPRDPSLDPQLVWRGKDEQDAQDLAVPRVTEMLNRFVSRHREHFGRLKSSVRPRDHLSPSLIAIASAYGVNPEGSHRTVAYDVLWHDVPIPAEPVH